VSLRACRSLCGTGVPILTLLIVADPLFGVITCHGGTISSSIISAKRLAHFSHAGHVIQLPATRVLFTYGKCRWCNNMPYRCFNAQYDIHILY
jgi:hypothetical protein